MFGKKYILFYLNLSLKTVLELEKDPIDVVIFSTKFKENTQVIVGVIYENETVIDWLRVTDKKLVSKLNV